MMNLRTIAPTSNFLNKGHLEDSRTYSTSLEVQKIAYPNPMVVLCRNWLHNDTTQRTPGNVEGLAKLPRISIAQGFAVNQNESMNQNVCLFVVLSWMCFSQIFQCLRAARIESTTRSSISFNLCQICSTSWTKWHSDPNPDEYIFGIQATRIHSRISTWHHETHWKYLIMTVGDFTILSWTKYILCLSIYSQRR